MLMYIKFYFTVSSVYITSAEPNVTAGSFSSLTCLATITGRGTPSFMWTGQMSRPPVAGHVTMENDSIFTDMFDLGRVGESNAGDYTCQVSLGSSSSFLTFTLLVTGELASM